MVEILKNINLEYGGFNLLNFLLNLLIVISESDRRQQLFRDKSS